MNSLSTSTLTVSSSASPFTASGSVDLPRVLRGLLGVAVLRAGVFFVGDLAGDSERTPLPPRVDRLPSALLGVLEVGPFTISFTR